MNRPSPARLVLVGVLLAGVGLDIGAPATQAGGPNHKTFAETLWVDPSSWPPATTDPSTTTSTTISAGAHDFYFRLTNTSSGSSAVPYGSARIVVPSGFTGISTTLVEFPPNFSVSGSGTTSPITIVSTGPTGSGVLPGNSIVVKIHATAPVGGVCPSTWTTGVKQSNDFSGSGNDFTGNSVSTPVAGSNHLAWTTQPINVQYLTTMDPAPVVAVLDACNQPVNTSGISITITDTAGHLVGTPMSTSTGANGTVSPSVSFNPFGYDDQLVATPDAASGVGGCGGNAYCRSTTFHVYQLLKPCSTNGTTNCSSGTLNGPLGETNANVNGAAGTTKDTLTVDIGGTPNDPTCAGEAGLPASQGTTGFGETVAFDVGPTRAKQVTMTLPRTYVNQIPNNGTPFMDICLSVPPTATPFVDKFGHVVPSVDGSVTSGLLADCLTSVDPGPCIVSRNKRGGDEIIVFNLPGGDPHTSWY